MSYQVRIGTVLDYRLSMTPVRDDVEVAVNDAWQVARTLYDVNPNQEITVTVTDDLRNDHMEISVRPGSRYQPR